MITKKILSDKKFWNKVSKEARDMIKRIIFDKGKTVYGGKWLDGQYSKFPSKWVMITIKEPNKKDAPKEGYSYAQAKQGNMFPTQSSTGVRPVLTGSLERDFEATPIKPNHNGFQIGFSTYGNVVEGLRKRFGKKGTITSKDRPMPIAVLKYVAKQYHLHIKKNKTCKVTRHKIG